MSAAPDPPSIVVKLGGDVLEGEALVAVAADVAAVARPSGGAGTPPRLILVHGGGPQATALSERLGLAPRIVGGRRVTDAATLDVMKMVVAGQLDVDLVVALRAAGAQAVGLSGTSGVVRARRRPPRVVAGGGPDPVDFGLVGDVVGFDLALLATLAGAGYLPVVACLGLAEGEASPLPSPSPLPSRGQALNINADVVASQLAAAARARALVAVTRVGGVRRDKDDPTTRIPRLTVAEARAAIADGTVKGGMIPKLEEAFAPLAAGVQAVHIVAPGEVAAALEAPGARGTLIVA
ncbi:MAG TPA: acetylglutamate kinase [Polyangia bacterium]